MLIFNKIAASGWMLCLALVSPFSLGSCGVRGESMENIKDGVDNSKERNAVVVDVEIVLFREQGLHDDFSDGSSVSYDVTALEILSHGEHQNFKITVAHQVTPEPDSLWRKVGARFSIRLDGFFLSNNRSVVSPESIEILGDP